MIENYDEVVAQWGCGCNNTMTVTPSEDMRRWAVQQTVTILANADYYYTKKEVDKILEEIVIDGAMTEQEVIELINRYIKDKADKAELEEVKEKVQENTTRILNTYTKTETNNLLKDYYTKLETRGMIGNYSQVDGQTLVLNANNITI